MAETLVTIAFLSAALMIASAFYEKGRLFSLIPIPFISLELFSIRFNAVHEFGGAVLWICLGMCVTSSFIIFKKNISHKISNALTGIATILLLLGYFPEEGIGETLQVFTTWESVSLVLLQSFMGIILAIAIYNVQYIPEEWYLLSLYAALLLGIVIDFWILVSIIDSPIIYTILLLPLLVYGDEKIDQKLGSGSGRSIALGITILIGIFLMYIVTWIQVSQIERIGDGYGAISATLWMIVAIVALGICGMLLPLIGFDAKARPEAWGWRTGLAISPMLLSIITDLAPLLMVGVWLAIIVSLTGPLVLEKNSKNTL